MEQDIELDIAKEPRSKILDILKSQVSLNCLTGQSFLITCSVGRLFSVNKMPTRTRHGHFNFSGVRYKQVRTVDLDGRKGIRLFSEGCGVDSKVIVELCFEAYQEGHNPSGLFQWVYDGVSRVSRDWWKQPRFTELQIGGRRG